MKGTSTAGLLATFAAGVLLSTGVRVVHEHQRDQVRSAYERGVYDGAQCATYRHIDRERARIYADLNQGRAYLPPIRFADMYCESGR